MNTRPLFPLEGPDSGSRWWIEALQLDNGRVPVEEFLSDLESDEADAFLARFVHMLDHEPFEAFPPKFKRYRGIWQVATYDHRILGFRNGQALVLTNGFKKTGKKTPPEEIERCEQLRDQFLRDVEGGRKKRG